MAANLEPVRASVEILRMLKAKKKALKELEDEHRALVEDAMGGSEQGILDGKLAVTWMTHKRRSLDQKALANDHPDIVEEYKKPTAVRRFELCEDEEADDGA